MANQSGRTRARNRDIPEDMAGEEFVEWLAGFHDNMLEFVRQAFPWGDDKTFLAHEDGPDVWQTEWMERLGREVAERKTLEEALASLRLATVSGNGTGKTTLIAWVILWFMSTRPHAHIRVTANTSTQLSTAVWRELAKWHNIMVHRDIFEWTASKYVMRAQPETWYAVAIPWSKENPNAFQGGHDQNILFIIDEAQGVHDLIWDAIEGSMTTAGAMWVVFGNGTRPNGRFRECFRKNRTQWIQFHVDARTAKKANKAEHEAWKLAHGEESDFYRVRVLGQFARASMSNLIPLEIVERAQNMFAARYPTLKKDLVEQGPEDALDYADLDPSGVLPRILSVDIARFGDDKTVVGLRVGATFVVLAKYAQQDTVQVAGRVAEWIKAIQPDVTFIDEAGIGGGVIDILRDMQFEITGVNGGYKAIDDRRYYNRRAEMYCKARDWLRGTVMIDDDRELQDDLVGPEYGFSDRGDRIQLETKEDMRSRGLPSPDVGDCLVQTFFMDIAPRERREPSVADRIAAYATGRMNSNGRSWQSY